MLCNCPRLLRLLVSLLLISSVTVIAETFCATISNVTLHDPSGPQPQTGNANLLGVGFKQAWPRFPSTKNGRRTIRYCYVDEAARKALQCSHMRPAMTAWAEAIGPIANAENRHSVAWKEIMFKHESGRWQPRFCFKQGGNEWNDGVPQDALAIHFEQGATPQATVGYTWSGPAGRHKMILPENASVRQVIHEIGHVLGMVHEHCRNHRDDHVEYRCGNIQGFGKALTSAILAGERDVSTRLCGDQEFAIKYGFDGSAYTKNLGYTDFAGRFDEGSFDMASVMMYPSNAYSNPGCSPTNMDVCPLVGLDKVNGKVVGKSWIYGNVAPSSGDVAFVRKWYPWEDDMESAPQMKARSAVEIFNPAIGIVPSVGRAEL